MGYIDQNLINDEVIVHRTGLHWTYLIGPIVCGGFLLTLGFGMIAGAISTNNDNLAAFGGLVFLAALGLIGVSVLRRRAVEMVVTNKRVVIKSGVFHKRTLEIFLPKVESIAVDQSLFGRMFKYGSIVVRGTGGTAEPFRKVRSPLEFRHQVHEQSEIRAHI